MSGYTWSDDWSPEDLSPSRTVYLDEHGNAAPSPPRIVAPYGGVVDDTSDVFWGALRPSGPLPLSIDGHAYRRRVRARAKRR